MVNMDMLLGPTGLTVMLGGTTLLLLYWYSVRKFSYWKKRGVPTANTVPVLGSLYELYKYQFHIMEEIRYKKLGRIFGHFETSTPLLSVADPSLLRDIFVKDFGNFHDRRTFRFDNIIDHMLTAVQGEDWKRIRSIVSPTFSSGKLKKMLNIIKDSAETMCKNFSAAAEGGKIVEAKGLFGAFSMDVIASSAFSTKIDSHNDRENKFVRMAENSFSEQMSWRFIMFFTAPSLMRLLKINVFEPEAIDFFVNVTHQIVEERRKSGKSRHDFLQLLMDTAKEVSEQEEVVEKGDITTNYEQENIEKQILKNVTSKHLSMDELVAQSVVFFLAGYHTTEATLAYATHSLAVNPDIQDKLRSEVDQVLNQHNGELTHEALKGMKYLDNVISETLRMYPPAARIERVSNNDYTLGDTGITIPKGMIVSVPVYAIHRDPEFYPDPEKFDPDRFTPEEREQRNPYCYLPFGAGPRNCVGMRFALMEIKVCLAYVISKFIIKRCPETQVPLKIFFNQGLLQPKSVYVVLEPRTDSPQVNIWPC